MGTDWHQLLAEIHKQIVPTFLIQEIHFIYPDCPDVVMQLDQLDADTLKLLGDSIQNLSAKSDSHMRLVIDVRKLQAHIEPFVDQMLGSLS